jgi:hypothetical protein
MKYKLLIGTNFWFPQECEEPFRKTCGFIHIEEALAHPGKTISLFRTHLAYNFNAKYSVPFDELNSGIGTDYLEVCSKGAVEERRNGLYLYKQYMLYKQKIMESMQTLSAIEVDYYSDQLEKLESIISKTLITENNLDGFIRHTNHNACTSVIKARKKLRVKAPMLAEYLEESITFGYKICYNRDEQNDFILNIFEEEPKN